MIIVRIIGVTGTSGSGKSEACKILVKKYDAELIDADKIAKKLSKRGTVYFNSIVESFGSGIVNKTGELNRKKLANIIYQDEKKREELNKLTFLYVVDEIKKIINKTKKKIIIVDAPLLFESKLDQICDFVISIIANEKVKIERICKRDGITKKEAESRLKAQAPNKFFIENSDYVIYNNNGVDELKEQIKIFGI